MPQGETLIGRSAVCHITLEDPLVSRRHARLFVAGDSATVEDLGSRNGLQVSGVQIRGVHPLSDGDRIRVGTQEFVFFRSEDAQKRTRSQITGFMCHCAACGLPYPAELPECPNCGATERSSDETLSGTDQSRELWTLELLVETAKRAGDLQRWDDVERAVRRSRAMVEKLAAMREFTDRQLLDRLASSVAAFSVARGKAELSSWILMVYARLELVPPRELGQSLFSLPPSERRSLLPAADLVAQSVGIRGTGQEAVVIAELRSLARGEENTG